jgi:hypothetical protein
MKHLLSSTAFLIVNKQLAKQVGLKGAVLLADLISKEEYFIANGMTDCWFFNSAKNIEEDTCLTAHQQRKTIKVLKELGIIETKVVGIPATQYFKIIESKLLSYLSTSCKENEQPVVKKTQTSCEESEELVVKIAQTINKNNNKNKEIIIINKYFNKPTLLEIKNYCVERVNNVDSEAFFDFYESKGWLVGKSKMKDWKAAIRTWERTETKKEKSTISKLDWQINEWQKAKKLL